MSRIIFLPLFVLTLLATGVLHSRGAVVVDSTTDIIFDTTSKAYTVNSGSNLGLVIAWANEGGSGATSGTWTVGVDVQNFTVVSASAPSGGSTSTHTAILYLKDPNPGSGTITLDTTDNNEEQRVYSLSNVASFVGANTSTGAGAGTVSLDFGATLPSDSLAIVGGNVNGSLTGTDPFFSATSGSATTISTDSLASASSDSYATLAEGVSGDLVLEAGADDRFAFSGVAATAIPEPSALALLGLGTLSLLARRRRKS